MTNPVEAMARAIVKVRFQHLHEVLLTGGVLRVEDTSEAEAIEKGLAALFYGDLGFPHDKSVQERWEGLNVLVYDDGIGNSIGEVLASITQYSGEVKDD